MPSAPFIVYSMCVFKNRSIKLLKPYLTWEGALVLNCVTSEIEGNDKALVLGEDYIFLDGEGDGNTRVFDQSNNLIHYFKLDI